MSAGNTPNEARVQSLSEIFERYVKNKIIAEGLCLPEIPQQVIDRFPGIKQSIEELQAHGYHLRIADASLGGKYPVISVTLINPRDGAVFASFGGHPCFEVAFERTVTELLQGRSLDQLDGFQPPSFDLDEVADHHYCCRIIHEMGFDIYISDYNHLNVYACRIIVPGMSDIYPVDDLQWSNNNEGAFLREDILSLKQLSKAQWQRLLQQLEDGGYNDIQRVAEFIGIAPDPATPWASLRIGELKAMLYLAIKDYEQAIEWND